MILDRKLRILQRRCIFLSRLIQDIHDSGKRLQKDERLGMLLKRWVDVQSQISDINFSLKYSVKDK
jgi:hypothetical protein